MKIDQILKVAVRGGASDVLLKVGAVPKFRLSGKLIPLSEGKVVTDSMMTEWLEILVPDNMKPRLQTLDDIDFAHQTSYGYRFRINVFRQRQQFGMVMRVVNNHIRTLEELQMPPVLATFAQESRGLVLVTGATGSGKSTTLAAIIERINLTRACHVITIEDPIEYTYTEKKATINQREVGLDATTFSSAIRSSLRQNPDIILVGELRDRDTIETALQAAETGHLVFSTLHTKNAPETLSRVLTYFDASQHNQLCLSLSQSLRAIVSQRLVPKADKLGMVPAIEIMVNNERIKELIREGRSNDIADVVRNNQDTYGMQTFDQSLLGLLEKGVITLDTAMAAATSPQDFALIVSGVS